MRGRIFAVVMAALLVATGSVVLRAPAASAAPACTVGWTANQWSTGFTAEVQVTNGGAPVTSWSLSWTFAGDQRVTGGWNAAVSQAGNVVTAASLGWNGTLATGAAARFGFQATYSGTNTAPTAFTFNGVSCSGDTPTPTTPAPTPTTPTPTPTTPTPTPTTPTPTPTTPTPTPTTPTPTPTGPQAGCVPTAICDSFENQAGSVPAGNWAITYPDCSGAGTAAVDRSVAHSGAVSLRVNGAAGYCNHVFVRNTQILGTAGTAWYVRFWVRHTTALPPAHVTAVAMQDSADGNRDLRFGGQNGALQFNRASDDATLPEQSPAGVALSSPLPINTWNCVEYKVDGRTGTIETWLNGTSIPGLLEDGTPTHDIDSQWLNRTWRPALTDLRLGWESYGEGADTLWYDDVAVGSTRNGC
ncbi:cellulose-binding domain-containing protein [Paractinoplanes maris]|uniref:cellulose-binding domain-containing protein n=1 Tax=Paractinoplanes maris TaxID=1734446 RepID=UPI002020CCF0|nr:cellulose-binding domain-containing protein [Actinoplanes maris]